MFLAFYQVNELNTYITPTVCIYKRYGAYMTHHIGEYELETHLTHANEFRERPDQVTELFNEFREKITNTRLFPLIRTKYARTAFQHTPHVDCRYI